MLIKSVQHQQLSNRCNELLEEKMQANYQCIYHDCEYKNHQSQHKFDSLKLFNQIRVAMLFTWYLILLLGNHHRSVAISWGSNNETIGSVDNVQFLSSINHHDGTVINQAILQGSDLLEVIITTTW